MKRKHKRKKWMKFRHKAITALLHGAFGVYTRAKYHIKIDPFREQGDRQYLILMNHQTAFDQFFVGIAFKGPVYYVASEDLFSNGIVSRLIEYLVAPVPIKKQATDVQAVFNCMRIVKEGGTIAVAPEGNRTYSGKLCYIKPSIVKLVRALKLPVAIFRIEGGYGIHPRWSDVIRRGRMHAYVSHVVEPEDYQALSDDELFELLRQAMDVDETQIGGSYFHKKSAEYLERAMYVCPDCGLSEWESHDDIIECKRCGRKVRYLPTKELEGVEKSFPFCHVADWYRYQTEFVRNLDLNSFGDEALYRDRVSMWEVILYKKKFPVRKETELALYRDRIEVGTEAEEKIVMPFENISVITVLGKNKLNIYCDGMVWQFKGDKRFNALKYVNLCYHYKKIREEYGNGEFLGL